MISLYLASEGLLHKSALYLSDYFERNKTAYVDPLMAVRQGNHLRERLIFFLFGVEETALASASAFCAIINLKQNIERDVMPRFSARRRDNRKGECPGRVHPTNERIILYSTRAYSPAVAWQD